MRTRSDKLTKHFRANDEFGDLTFLFYYMTFFWFHRFVDNPLQLLSHRINIFQDISSNSIFQHLVQTYLPNAWFPFGFL